MSRLISQDFECVMDFLKSYNIKDVCNDDNFHRSYKKIHKKQFSLLIFSSEINELLLGNDSCIFRIKETYSDIAISSFLLVHGMYKQAYMSLRSSIENFLKSICCTSNPSVLTDKSVYSIFEKTKELDYFKNKDLNDMFNELNSCYEKLCHYTHTATTVNMSNLSALNSIPMYDLSKVNEFTNLFNRVTSNILLIYICIHRELFYSMNQSNRIAILESFSTSTRRKIHENLFVW